MSSAATTAQSYYRTNGFYLSDTPLIPTALVQKASAGMDAIRAGIYDTGRPPQPSPWNPGDDPGKLCKIEMPQMANRAILDLVGHPAIGALAAALTGAAMVQVWWVQLLYKPAVPRNREAALKIGWHQDRHYWTTWEEGSELFTAWVALSPVAADCGPMKFVRGSHRWGLVEGGDFFGQDHEAQQHLIQSTAAAAWEEVDALLPAGGVSFHHNLTYHASGLNHSAGPRRSLAIHLRTQNSRPLDDARRGLTAFIDDPSCCPVIFAKNPSGG